MDNTDTNEDVEIEQEEHVDEVHDTLVEEGVESQDSKPGEV